MHAKTAEEQSPFLAMLKKDNDSHREVTKKYVGFWQEDERDGRKQNYMSVANSFYDLATDMYEQGWAQSFHFSRFAINEPLLQALARHEHYLAYMMNIKKDMTVLDMGCGIGGPAREIAAFTKCKVVGVNNNGYQIQRAVAYTEKAGLDGHVSFVKNDFMAMEFPDNSFDAVYAIESTVHAPSLQKVYEQAYRVLKPGGTFAVYEWVMTDTYDEYNPAHSAIRLGIERGNGIPAMMTRKHAIEAIKAAGFVLEHAEDQAEMGDQIPWYAPLAGEFPTGRLLDFGALRTTKLGRVTVNILLSVLETFRLAPSGIAEMAREFSYGADNLVRGGKEGIFTPMYLMVGKKPEI
ncbi:sterol 24-C-methyltransferase [Arthroderma uncinatum]|uniref:sterol 24-C-methyltransferase n=1 Tax=Arthroderma uncinatum TaxID=74035 RepID=UPI00144AA7E1|nr:sterol 24-C-methyltransferase [Arthroderma uncinatum]KAF3483778.1 sterol 24-C-methyltransferase [Arthroderma uncinatum]